MATCFNITNGLDLPIRGAPQQSIEEAPAVPTVALVGDDYIGMRPTMEVEVGDRVKRGQLLFTDKKTPGVRFTSPGSGLVLGLHRGPKRKFESVVIELEGDEQVPFESFRDQNLTKLPRGAARDHLIASGLWTALRTRPYSKVPSPNSVPHALFVTAIDTNPLAVDPAVVLADREADFVAGLEVLSTLTDGTTYLCKQTGANIPGCDLGCVQVAEFAGPHPAGLVGTHIHFLSPASEARSVWHIDYQDVLAVGHLFLTGELSVERVISLAGPAAIEPRLLRTRLGASLEDLTAGQYHAVPSEPVRIISGSVLSGRRSQAPRDYLGRYHSQISLLTEGHKRRFLGWLTPGRDRFSITRAFSSGFASGEEEQFAMTTSTEGSLRAIVPLGLYEKVMPLDLVATPLLKSLVVEDTEYAETLGCLELDEEDLALCTFVCPSKIDYGLSLRKNLTQIEMEG